MHTVLVVGIVPPEQLLDQLLVLGRDQCELYRLFREGDVPFEQPDPLVDLGRSAFQIPEAAHMQRKIEQPNQGDPRADDNSDHRLPSHRRARRARSAWCSSFLPSSSASSGCKPTQNGEGGFGFANFRNTTRPTFATDRKS